MGWVPQRRMLQKVVASEEMLQKSRGRLRKERELNETKVQEQDLRSGLLMGLLVTEAYSLSKGFDCHESPPDPNLGYWCPSQ